MKASHMHVGSTGVVHGVVVVKDVIILGLK